MSEKEKNMQTRPKNKVVKRLFAISGNICYFPNCNQKLTLKNDIVIGMICHIKGKNPGSARYDENQIDEKKHSIQNLMLLCPTCHTIIDSNPKDYTVELLLEIKNNHEETVEKVQEATDYIVQQLLFKNINEDISNYHDDRIESIENKTVILIHLIPLSTFQFEDSYTLDEIASYKESLKPILYHVIGERFISNKFIRFHKSIDNTSPDSYVCVARDGTIEALDELLLEQKEGNLVITNPFFENKIIETISNYLKFSEDLGIELPLKLIISLIGIKDYCMKISIEGKYIAGHNLRSHCTIEEIIKSPEITIREHNSNIEEIIKPCFDRIWSAFNYPGRPDYDNEENIFFEYKYYKN